MSSVENGTTQAFIAWKRKRQLYKRYSVTRFHLSNVYCKRRWQLPKELYQTLLAEQERIEKRAAISTLGWILTDKYCDRYI